MKSKLLDDSSVPYFAWDRNLSVGAIKDLIGAGSGFEWNRTASWIMREAAFADVWQFLRPDQVRESFSDLEPMLGRRKEFWQYIIGKWHELGKL